MYKIRYIFFIIFFLNYIDSMGTSKKRDSDFILRENLKKRSKIEFDKFNCTVDGCHYSTEFKSHLKSHILYKHNQERNFKCTFENCAYSGKTNMDLKQHILHKHNQERNFKCPFENCNYSSKTNSNLKKHIVCIHNQEKNFKCPFENCNYKAKTNSALNIHIRYKHSQEKKFKCVFENCNYSTKTMSDLKKHLGSIHKKESIESALDNCKDNLNQLETHKNTKEPEKEEEIEFSLFDNKGLFEDLESILALSEEV